MKRILSLILCVLMLIPCFVFAVSADEEISDEYKNFALDDGVSAYGTSKWNNDSDPKYINNNDLYDDYRFWRPDGYGRTGTDDTLQYCGLKYTESYYEVDKVVLYVGHYDATNDILYTITALVLGEWVEIGSARATDGVADMSLSNDTDYITIDVENVVTKNIRVECTEYGRWSTYNQEKYDTAEKFEDDPTTPDVDESKTPTAYHDWWKIPIIHEVQTWGTEAPPPPWDVPDGAVLSTNACLSGFADASSSYTTRAIYPALANDNLIEPTLTTARPYWMAYNKGAGESIWCEFDKAYDIVNVSVNFGGSVDGTTLKYDIQIMVNGVWKTVVSDKTATTSRIKQDDIVYDLSAPMNATGVKVIFSEVSGGDERATVTEIGALIDSNYKVDGVDSSKCVFLNEFLTANRKQSTAIGNLACFGSAYASSVMTYASISAVDYINDGGIAKNEDFSWFANTFAKGTYCGVVLKNTYNVNKVVLYFNDAVTGDVSGDCVMQFDIQVKNSNGEFITVKKDVTSYDKTNKEYIVSVLFDEPVATNDVRIVYTSNGMVFPYIKELEVYASDYVYGAYRGYSMGQRTNGGKVANTASDFASRTLIPRSKYLDKISPIQYFELAMEYGLDILAWL